MFSISPEKHGEWSSFFLADNPKGPLKVDSTILSGVGRHAQIT